MSHQLHTLLKTWKQTQDQTDWVLGTVYKTEGSAYRKAGAMMLINGFGQHFGLLSGGCLEADVVNEAHKCMHDRQVRLLSYDSSDEDDWSYQLGIGCGGKVYIMLQPVLDDVTLGLENILTALQNRTAGRYLQKIGAMESQFESDDRIDVEHSVIENREDGDWLITSIQPEPHLIIFGGGVDARPLASIASTLGWQTTVADSRPANARAEHFPSASRIFRNWDAELDAYIEQQRVDAAVIMSHNLKMDATALKLCQSKRFAYIALLGPRHRFEQVLQLAELSEQQLSCPVSAPAGLDIGGQLPESIALSILSECHAVLHRAHYAPSLTLAITG